MRYLFNRLIQVLLLEFLNKKFHLIVLLFILICNTPIKLKASEEDLSLILFYNQSRFNMSTTSKSNYGSSAFGGETDNYGGNGYGLLYEKPIKNQWSFETGFIYFSRGWVVNGETSLDTSTTQWSSLFVPLVGRFRPTKTFNGFIGTYGSYAVGTVTTVSKSTYNPKPVTTKESFDKIGLTPFESGLTYGAGVNYDLNNSTRIILEIRFIEGLTNIIDPKVNDNSNNNSNSGISIESKAFMRETWFVLGFII